MHLCGKLERYVTIETKSFTVRTSPIHHALGEAFGVVMWLWIFHRARHDGPVVLGLRHPWDHVEDPWAAPHHDTAHDEKLEH
jgi:hypothetical protein